MPGKLAIKEMWTEIIQGQKKAKTFFKKIVARRK